MTDDAHFVEVDSDLELRPTRNLEIHWRQLRGMMRIMKSGHLASTLEGSVELGRFETALPEHMGFLKAAIERGDFILKHRSRTGEWHTIARIRSESDVSVSRRFSQNKELAEKVRDTMQRPLWYFTSNQGIRTRCIFCGRDLEIPQSRQLGYGPVCARRLNLPH